MITTFPTFIATKSLALSSEQYKLQNWRGIVTSFVNDCDVKDSSRALYFRTLTAFFRWVKETARLLNSLVRADIILYKKYLQKKGLSPLTIGAYLVAVRKFYEWAEANKIYPNIAKGIKTPKRVQAFKKQHLTEAQCKALIEYASTRNTRDNAIINLLLRTGLRTIEVVRADIGDITLYNGVRILKVWGKGRDAKDDFVILSDKTYSVLSQYLASRKNNYQGSPLFASESLQNKGERLTTRTIRKIVKDALLAIGAEGREFTAHSLRHTTAVHLLKSGATLEGVQSVLRHTSPNTTQIYVESIKVEMRLAHGIEKSLDNIF